MGIHTGHIGVNVTNMERSKKFYQDVFGFKLMTESSAEGRKFAFLGDGESLILTLWEQSVGNFDPSIPGLHHLSFQVDSIEQVKEFEVKLHNLGINFLYDGIVPHAEGKDSGGVFFEDPDHIRLEIFSPSGARDHEVPVAGAPSCGFF